MNSSNDGTNGQPLDIDDVIENGGDLFDIEEQLQPPPANNVVNVDFMEFPVIRMEENIQQNAEQVIRQLARCHNIYKREGKLVQVATVAPELGAVEELPSAKIYEIPPAKLKSIISHVCRFEGIDNRGAWAPKKPSPDIASAVFSDVEFDGVRELLGVAESPLMRADGSVLSRPGYDSATKLIYTPRRHYTEVEDHPTLEDAKRAFEFLQRPWCDFPTTTENGKLVPIAALLTIVARHAVCGAVPAFAFDASTPGSGKSIQANCVSILATGRKISFTNWPDDDDREVEKVIGSFVLAGARVIAFDNVRPGCAFGGPALDAKLTADDKTSFRILGQSKTVDMPWRSTIMVTGNNMAIGPDTTRRTLIQRLEPAMEKPEERDRSKYSIPDLEVWCMENHPQMVHAALTLLRAYHAAGKPLQKTKSWGSFQQWTNLVAGAIAWASGMDVLETRAAVAGDPDEKSIALQSFLPQWRSFAPQGMSARKAIETLYSINYMRGEAMPDGRDALREAIEVLAPPDRSGGKPDANKLGYALRSKSGQWSGGYRLESSLDRTKTKIWIALSAGEPSPAKS